MKNSDSPSYVFPLENAHEYLKDPRSNFVGREDMVANIANTLKNSFGRGGSILIGGYRGVGKSLLIDKVLDRLTKDSKIIKSWSSLCGIPYFNPVDNNKVRLVEVKINLGVDSDLKVKEILYDISESIHKKLYLIFKDLNLFLFIVSVFSSLVLGLFFGFCDVFNFNKSYLYLVGLYSVLAFIFLSIIVFSVLFKISTTYRVYRQSKRLIEAIRYSKMYEGGVSVGKSLSLKAVLKEEKITTRRIQQDLQDLFWELTGFGGGRFVAGVFQPVIIIDEVDKINPGPDELEREASRGRKEKVDNLLGGLKSLLNNTHAIFVFIAGREMVDAYYSESGYTSVLYEGVFQEIFYVPTLVSDKSKNEGKNYEYLVESFVVNILSGKSCESKSRELEGRADFSVEVLEKYFNYNLQSYEVVFQRWLKRYFLNMYACKHGLKGVADSNDVVLDSKIEISDGLEKEFLQFMCDIEKTIDHELFGEVLECIVDEVVFGIEKSMDYKRVSWFDYGQYVRLIKRINLACKLELERITSVHLADFKFVFNIFISYLLLHSWGNSKRITMLIKEFVRSDMNGLSNLYVLNGSVDSYGVDGDSYYLVFSPEDIRRFLFSSKLYTLFKSGLGAQIDDADDKLIVSGFISILDIIKFHSQGFMRGMIDRTVAGIDVHAELNLVNIIDDLLNSTFYSLIRRTTDNLYQYRFYLTADIEASYITKFIGMRSASFEFSLDSADPVRQYYLRESERQISENSNNSPMSSAKLQIVIGDIFLSERNYDKCFSYYTNSIYLLKKILRSPDGVDWRKSGGVSLEAHFLLIQVLLKKGLLEETRENYSSASRIYREAQTISQYYFEAISSNDKTKSINDVETKFESNIKNYEEWLKRENSNGDEVSVRHRNFIVHCILATDFLRMKSGMEPKVNFYKNLIKFETDNTEFNLYSKIMLMNFYGGEYEHIIERSDALYSPRKRSQFNSDNYQRLGFHLYRDRNLYVGVYIYGQSLFLSAGKMLKRIFDCCSESNRSDIGAYIWLNVVLEVYGMSLPGITQWNDTDFDKNSYDNLDAEAIENFNRLRKKEEKYFKGLFESISNNDVNDKLDKNLKLIIPNIISVIKFSFRVILRSCQGMSEKGNYSLSSHYYLSLILNWVSILELYPWSSVFSLVSDRRFISDGCNKYSFKPIKQISQEGGYSKVLHHLFQSYTEMNVDDKSGNNDIYQEPWILSILSEARIAIEKSDLGAYIPDRARVFRQEDGDSDGSEYASLRLNYVFDSIRNPDPSYHVSTLAVWYRPNISNYLLMFGLWQDYCCISIASRLYMILHDNKKPAEKLKIRNFSIKKFSVPPTNLPRINAIYKLLAGRYEALKLFVELGIYSELILPQYTNKSTDSAKFTDEYLNNLSDNYDIIVEIFSNLFEALQQSKMSSRSDDPDTFPPKSIIYFNIYEAAEYFYFPFLQDGSKSKHREYANRIRTYFRDRGNEFFVMFSEPSEVKPHLERYSDDLSDIGNITSNAYRRKIRHKYYLYDDFEDPFFLAEWSFLNMLSSGAKSHVSSLLR